MSRTEAELVLLDGLGHGEQREAMRDAAFEGVRHALPGRRTARCGMFPVPQGMNVDELRRLWVDCHRQRLREDVFFAGLERCYSPHTCVLCAATVSAHWADCIEIAVARWKARGGEVLFVTFTMSHKAGDSLHEAMTALDVCATRMFSKGSRPAERLMGAVGLSHWVWRFEVTEGDNGWHAHVHGLMFLDRGELADNELEGLQLRMAQLLQEWQVALWGRKPSLQRVCVLERVRDGRGSAEYLAKVGLEMTAVSTKESRSSTRSFWDMARYYHYARDGDGRDVVAQHPARDEAMRRWGARIREFDNAFKGRRFFKTNQQFWAVLLPEVEERSSRDIVSAGRALEKKYRKLKIEAREQLSTSAGECVEVVETPNDQEVAVERVEPDDDIEHLARIDSYVWTELMEAIRNRCRKGGVPLVPDVLRWGRFGPRFTLAHAIRAHGAVEGLRRVVACMPNPAPIWMDDDGLVYVTRRPDDDWELVEGWGLYERSRLPDPA